MKWFLVFIVTNTVTPTYAQTTKDVTVLVEEAETAPPEKR